MTQYQFTVTAVFDADDEEDAWGAWTEWLTWPSHIVDGTVVKTWQEVQ